MWSMLLLFFILKIWHSMFSGGTFALLFYKCLQLCRYFCPGHKLDPVSGETCAWAWLQKSPRNLTRTVQVSIDTAMHPCKVKDGRGRKGWGSEEEGRRWERGDNWNYDVIKKNVGHACLNGNSDYAIVCEPLGTQGFSSLSKLKDDWKKSCLGNRDRDLGWRGWWFTIYNNNYTVKLWI